MRNLNRVCNEEIEEPTGQETIREREKKYKKRENVCSLLYMGPANKQGKKEHALEGKRNRNLRKQASGLDSVLVPVLSLVSKAKRKIAVYYNIIRNRILLFFSYLDLDQELGFHRPHKQVEGQTKKNGTKKEVKILPLYH